MFDHTQYVPVIRWKAGEQWALRELRPDIRRRVTPLLELLPKNFEAKKSDTAHDIEGRMAEVANDVVKSWGLTPFFIDTTHVENLLLEQSRTHPLRLLGNEMRKRALKGIPVTDLSRSNSQKDAAQAVAAKLGQGIAVRILRHGANASLDAALECLLNRLVLTPSDVHLIVDQQVINGSVPATSIPMRIAKIAEWKSFTLLGGAFPIDLSKIEKNTQEELPRAEWEAWKRFAKGPYQLSRMPTFGDYTVQHAAYREPPPSFNMSASIRYTSDDYWVIMRGEGVLNDDGPGYDGFLGNARLLVEREEFCGEDFSAGDQYIQQMSLQSEKPGSAQTWIRAAINHHITFAVQQIAKRTGS